MTEDSSFHWRTKPRHLSSETSGRAGLEFVCIFGHDELGVSLFIRPVCQTPAQFDSTFKRPLERCKLLTRWAFEYFDQTGPSFGTGRDRKCNLGCAQDSQPSLSTGSAAPTLSRPLSPCHLQRLPHFIHSGRPAGCEKLDSTVDWTTLSIASNEIKESKGNLDVGLWPPLQLGSLPSE